jgi:glycosyltransferase involved in cell wall biosynthesis
VVDLIDNGHSGIIVDPDAASLAAAAERVLTDSGLAEGLGRNARERARGIEAHEQANRLLIRYDALRLSARRSRRGLRGLATRAREEVAAWR